MVIVASMTPILVPKNSKRDIAMSGLMSVLRQGLVGVSNGGLRIWPWWLLGRRQHSNRFVVGLHDQKVQAKVHQFWWHTRSMTHVCPLFGWWLMDVDGPHMVPTILATCIFGFLGWWSPHIPSCFQPTSLLFSARLQGVDPADPQSFAMAKGLAESPQTQLAGLYTHGGHSYDAQVGPVGPQGMAVGTWGRLGGNRETLRIVWVYGDLFQEDWQWLAHRMGLSLQTWCWTCCFKKGDWLVLTQLPYPNIAQSWLKHPTDGQDKEAVQRIALEECEAEGGPYQDGFDIYIYIVYNIFIYTYFDVGWSYSHTF